MTLPLVHHRKHDRNGSACVAWRQDERKGTPAESELLPVHRDHVPLWRWSEIRTARLEPFHLAPRLFAGDDVRTIVFLQIGSTAKMVAVSVGNDDVFDPRRIEAEFLHSA